MSENEWLGCTDPTPMLSCLRDSGKLSERKARLFAVACGRNVWRWMMDERSRQAVEVCEQYAEGLVGQKALKAVRRKAFAASKSPVPSSSSGYAAASEHAAIVALNVCMNTKRHDCQVMASATAGCASSLVAHVLGDAAARTENKAQCDLLRCIFGNPFHSTSSRAWQTPTVVSLAHAADDERHLPAGTLDPIRLSVLADALEEAGCTDADMVSHLRGAGPHVRGCWVVDLILGKR
jgi:hypothetical protein